jgi:para-nitrobenzyl esterase
VNTQREVVVRTTRGPVRGGSTGNGVAVFLGIPYAEPPRGAERFAAPRPHSGWEETRDCTAPGPTAPQSERKLGVMEMSAYFGSGWNRGEDYLTVNVWTPEAAVSAAGAGGAADTTDAPDAAHARRPVMVFVHGGGFVAGSNSADLYDGRAFAHNGVLLISVNYRLGIAGFLDVPGAPANRGLLDVVEALKWVRENATRFGGDPGNVTVFGQSAGATIVCGLLAHPPAGGLFQRAIVQSGSGLGAFSPAQAARVTRAAAEELGIDLHGAGVQQFGAVPDERLVAAAGRLTGLDLRIGDRLDPLLGLSPFSLVLAEQPAGTVAAWRGAPVDLLIGANSEEGNLYLAPFGNYDTATAADVDAAAERAHPAPADLVKTLRAARPGASESELRSAIMGGALFGSGTSALADAHARSHPARRTYRYEFAWRSQALSGTLGAAHTVELPFVFHNTALPTLNGENTILGPAAPPAELADRMHRAWIDFATTGSPGWDRYETSRRATMIIDTEWALADDHRAPERRAWSRGWPTGITRTP